jgi:hypothetical protein
MAALYEMVERMHSAELQRAMSMAREVEQAIETQRTIVRATEFDRREALVIGDRMGWSFADTQQEIAAWRAGRLEETRVKREELSGVARERYAASHLRSEQMNRVVGGVAARVEMEEGRRAQAMTDDRFLSRKLWVETREEARQESR